MKVDVDACGLACPQPVIRTKKALDNMEAGIVVTVVDNEVARDNVKKLAASLGYDCSVEEKEELFVLTVTKGETTTTTETIVSVSEAPVLFITQEGMGHGDAQLGTVLMKSMFFTLVEDELPPKAILLVNGGVKLACADSPILEHLQNLAERGTQVLACGTCLDFFKLKDKLQVGEIGNMYTILEYLKGPDKVINI